MIIDCHSHLAPKSWFHPKSPKAIFDIEGVLEEPRKAGVDITVFGNNWIRTPAGADSLNSGDMKSGKIRGHNTDSCIPS